MPAYRGFNELDEASVQRTPPVFFESRPSPKSVKIDNQQPKKMDDKALISNLLVQGSDRVQLVVFKEARAEIWKIFRLVYLDNKPMPYAVCVKCRCRPVLNHF